MSQSKKWWKTAIALFLVAIMLFPVYWMVNVSFTKRGSIRKGDLFPFDFTLENYQVVFSDQMTFLATSIVIGLGTALLTLVVAAPSAFALSKLMVPGRKSLNFILIVAQMVPAVVMSLGFYSLYNQLGMLDTVWGLIIADSTIAVPFAVLLLTSFMVGIPKEILQSSEIDGASTPRTFVSIVLPLSRNSGVTAALFAFLWAWSDFIFASTLNRSGGAARPITMGIYNYIGAQNQEWGPLMATAVVAAVPTALLLIVAQRYIAAGLTAGAVKD